MVRIAAAVLLVALLDGAAAAPALASAAAAQAPASAAASRVPGGAPAGAETGAERRAPEARFGDEITVPLLSVVVRAVDGAGNPLRGLAPSDFRVRVGRQEVTVAAVDWIDLEAPPPSLASAGDSGQPETPVPASPPATGGQASAGAPAPALLPDMARPAGKLVVFFVQADNNAPGRTRGHLWTLPFTRELLSSLAPGDRAAVVSFDSHLKLWLDFTRDRAPVHEAIFRAIHFGGRPPAAGGASDAPPSLSLRRRFDFEQARRAASPERALAVTAEALAPLPGEKVLVFLGWGLGSFSSFGTQMTPAFGPAVRALQAARATVFVLDVTEAGAHDLEVGLRAVADATGGTYDKTNDFPALAVRHLARTISGYYLLTLDATTFPSTGGDLDVTLRRRSGTVLARPLAISPAAPAAR